MGRPPRHPRHRGRAVPHPERPGPHLSEQEIARNARNPSRARSRSSGPRPSPNIWHHPGTYELENHAFDPDGSVWSALRALTSYDDRDVLDLGCGTGFHLPRFAATARSVVGVEPHPALAALARRRTRKLDHVEVREGLAESLPVPDASVDVVHARWAYFFGPGSEPGLAELGRVVRRGGTAVVIDNDPTASTFGSWFRRGFPEVNPSAVESFWTARGWRRTPITAAWRFEHRADFEAVVRIELPTATAEAVLAEHDGLEVDYAVNLWSKEF